MKGTFETSGEDSIIVPADPTRLFLIIQTTGAAINLGFGELAEDTYGICMMHIGDTVTIGGEMAALAVHAVGINGYGGWQSGYAIRYTPAPIS
jgi:hypothetical protein